MIDKILQKYINNEKNNNFINYDLSAITSLLDILEKPQNEFKSIHVAGTNGKGSTCFMIARVLEKAGYNTGLFISPHLLKINERISINSNNISDEDLLIYIKKIDYISNKFGISITYFDLLTAVSFCYFKDKKVDIAIIETGLGGRLDSTNIITPLISVITDISLDHTHILGKTLEEITREKCGIIKNSIPVISSNTESEIVQIIKDYIKNKNADLYLINTNFKIINSLTINGLLKYTYIFQDTVMLDIEIPLMLEHQVKNSAISITALILLKENGFIRINPEIITTALKCIKIPGRFQQLCEKPLIIFDPAHNYSSLKNLLSGIISLYKSYKLIMILTMMKDKISPDILRLLKDSDCTIIYYILNDQRAYIPEKKFFHIQTDNKIVIHECIKTEKNNKTLFLFTGTFRIFNLAVEIAEEFK